MVSSKPPGNPMKYVPVFYHSYFIERYTVAHKKAKSPVQIPKLPT